MTPRDPPSPSDDGLWCQVGGLVDADYLTLDFESLDFTLHIAPQPTLMHYTEVPPPYQAHTPPHYPSGTPEIERGSSTRAPLRPIPNQAAGVQRSAGREMHMKLKRMVKFQRKERLRPTQLPTQLTRETNAVRASRESQINFVPLGIAPTADSGYSLSGESPSIRSPPLQMASVVADDPNSHPITARTCSEEQLFLPPTLTPETPPPSGAVGKRRRNCSAELEPPEDAALAAATSDTHNILLRGQPVSGKTTLAEAIGAAHVGLGRVLLVTASARLRDDTRGRLGPQPAHCHVDVESETSLTTRLFPGIPGWGESRLRAAFEQGVPPKVLEPYDLIIVDDAQNCTPAAYRLLVTVLTGITRHSTSAPRIVLCFDPSQVIRNQSDPRFYELAPELFPFLSRPWETVTLHTSMGLSYQTAAKLNDICFDRLLPLVGSYGGPDPIFHDFSTVDTLLERVLHIIRCHSSFSILAPFVEDLREDDPLSQFVRRLMTLRYHLKDPSRRGIHLDPRPSWGKILVATYSQMHGIQRDLVIIFRTHDWKARQLRPGAIRVGMTRAKQLVIVDLPGTTRSAIRPLDVSRIASNVLGDVLDRLLRESSLDVKEVAGRLPELQHITPPSLISTNYEQGHCEDVSDVNGIMVTRAFELSWTSQPPKSVAQLAKETINQQAVRSGFSSRQMALADHPCDWMKIASRAPSPA
ncbi:hypothetical protein FB451DRAFT_1554160 [Mycena latifolia]|nr:hypothetical protein FB451DRAFT_1554160 [Mycena latifolia]